VRRSTEGTIEESPELSIFRQGGWVYLYTKRTGKKKGGPGGTWCRTNANSLGEKKAGSHGEENLDQKNKGEKKGDLIGRSQRKKEEGQPRVTLLNRNKKRGGVSRRWDKTHDNLNHLA